MMPRLCSHEPGAGKEEKRGRAHIGSITGLVQFVTTLIGALGPLIAGVVSDQTGSYETALYVLIATWLACGAVIFAIRPEREPKIAVAEAVKV